jgi:hypothetical protein
MKKFFISMLLVQAFAIMLCRGQIRDPILAISKPAETNGPRG